MRYLIISWLFIKRIIKNPAFICVLIIMPLLITMFNKVDTKDEKKILVGVYHEEEGLSKLICENLKDKEGYIKFLVYNNKAEMIEAVETKKLECSYIFPVDFKERFDNYKIKRCLTWCIKPFIISSNVFTVVCPFPYNYIVFFSKIHSNILTILSYNLCKHHFIR